MTSQTPQPAPASNSPQPTATPPTPAKPSGLLSGPFGVVLSLALLGTAGYLSYRALYQATPEEPQPMQRLFMCAETQKTFRHVMARDETVPVMSPHSSKKTGYPCYPCFRTADGEIRDQPVNHVILNKDLDKEGPTECPVCGHMVTGHEDPQGLRLRSGRAPNNADGDEPDEPPASQPATEPG